MNLTAWPDIAKITANSDFSWYNHVPEIHEQQQMDFKLDLQLIRHLWKSVNSEKGEDREVLLEMYKDTPKHIARLIKSNTTFVNINFFLILQYDILFHEV